MYVENIYNNKYNARGLLKRKMNNILIKDKMRVVNVIKKVYVTGKHKNQFQSI